MMLIDTHAHLDSPDFAEDLDHVLLRAKQASVERIITIGRTLQSSRKAIQLAERYPQIYASVGIHPNSASQECENFLSELEEMVKHPRVVASERPVWIIIGWRANKRNQKSAKRRLEPLPSPPPKTRSAMKPKWPHSQPPLNSIWNLLPPRGKAWSFTNVIPGKIQSRFFASTQPAFEQ